MLVNAHDFPGPALFQGLGLIAAAIWAVWLHSRPLPLDRWAREAQEKAEQAKRDADMAEYNRKVGQVHS